MATTINESNIGLILNNIINQQYNNTLNTGIIDLDQILYDWQVGISIFSARPKMGITAFFTNHILQILKSIKDDETILYVSTKDSITVLIQRLLAIEGNINISKIQRCELNESDKMNLKKLLLIKKIESGCLYILENTNPKIYLIRNMIFEKIKLGKKPTILFIDTLVMFNEHGNQINKELNNLMFELHFLSKEFQIPIICSIPLQRAVEYRESKLPKLVDLNSELINLGSRIIFLNRPEYYEIKDVNDSEHGLMQLIIAKNNGPLDMIDLKFNSSTLKIEGNANLKFTLNKNV